MYICTREKYNVNETIFYTRIATNNNSSDKKREMNQKKKKQRVTIIYYNNYTIETIIKKKRRMYHREKYNCFFFFQNDYYLLLNDYFVHGHHVLFQIRLEGAPFLAYRTGIHWRFAALERQMSGQGTSVPVVPAAVVVNTLVVRGGTSVVRVSGRT